MKGKAKSTYLQSLRWPSVGFGVSFLLSRLAYWRAPMGQSTLIYMSVALLVLSFAFLVWTGWLIVMSRVSGDE